MNATIWNRIVQHYRENLSAKEEVLQKDWERIFSDLFDYKEFFGEIDAHRVIPIGAGKKTIPDIIIKENGKDLFDVELKQYSLPFSSDMENQLKSYLDLLHISVGILICQNLYLYIYDFGKSKFKKMEITFVENNPDGIKFIELFRKGQFSPEKVESYIDQHRQRFDHIEAIKAELTSQGIMKIAKEHFSTQYSEEEIEAAFNTFEISVCPKNSHFVPPVTTKHAPLPPAGIPIGDIFAQTAKEILAEYDKQGELHFLISDGKKYIRFQTKDMTSLLPNMSANGSWGLGVKYLFWLGEQTDHTFTACFELGGWDRDASTIQTMNRIIQLRKPNDKKTVFRYKRIYTKSYSYTQENMTVVIEQAINNLLAFQEALLKNF